MFKDILTTLGLDYRDASLIKLFLEESVLKSDESVNFNIQKLIFKKQKISMF